MSTRVAVQLSGDLADIASFPGGSSSGLVEINQQNLPAQAVEKLTVSFPVSTKTQLLFMVASINCIVLVNSDSLYPGTGSTGTGASAKIVMKAGVPVVWWPGIGTLLTSVFGASPVTSLYVDNNGDTAGTFSLDVQYDPTP